MKESYLYKETQVFHILIIFMIIFLAGFQALLHFGSNTYTSITTLIGTAAIFVIILLLFFNFKIVVTHDFLKLSFGIGVISVKYPLKNIAVETIAQERIPGWVGMGIRLVPGGRLVYNTKPGTAVCFNTFSGRFRVCVVSTAADVLERVLKEQCSL